ncbi:hypothetical protein F2Q69_00062860 [Brassica cretica]|uniref:Uncharacterized protein n=1 Tax=Brassica cretica TaxID=69181 RepID=A0A8S9RHB1_BRACR|nr:hypothetical protein F2Q69_00062860 [Brassica cretica]
MGKKNTATSRLLSERICAQIPSPGYADDAENHPRTLTVPLSIHDASILQVGRWGSTERVKLVEGAACVSSSSPSSSKLASLQHSACFNGS